MPGPEQRALELKARVRLQLEKNREYQRLKEKKKQKAGEIGRATCTNKNKSATPEILDALAAPPPVKCTTGSITESKVKMANKSKMTVYNDPVESSSLKRKANCHVDAPAPKKFNTNIFAPRAPWERYQGTATRSSPTSRPVLKRKPTTQQKVRDNNAININTPSSSSGKNKTVRGNVAKEVTAMDSDISSSVGRKRDAEKGLNERAAKKQSRNFLPSSNLMMAQASKAGIAAPSGVISVKPTPKTNFFNSLYAKDSIIKASTGRSMVSTEVVSTAVPPTAVRTPNFKHTTPGNTTSVIDEPRSRMPLEGPKNSGNDPLAKNVALNKKSLKRKDRASEEGIEGNESKKLRRDDGSWSTLPSIEENPKSNSDSEDKVRGNKTSKSRSHAGRVQSLFDDSKTEIARLASGRSSPSAVTFDHAPSANDIPATEVKIDPSEGKNDNNSVEDARPSVERDSANARNGELPARATQPQGIFNEEKACYINSVLQVIANIPEMANHYRLLANRVIPEVTNYVARNAWAFESNRRETKYINTREQVKVLLEKNRSKICLGAYLGALLNEMLEADTPTGIASSYLFRQACGVLLVNLDEGQLYNGETSQECMEYFEVLLDHLDKEERDERTENFEAPSLVRELFGLKAATKLKCQSCCHAWDSCTVEEIFGVHTKIPRLEPSKSEGSSVSLTECVNAYSDPDLVEIHCEVCGKMSEAKKWMQLKDLSPYILINLDRVSSSGSQNQMQAKISRSTVPVRSSGIINMRNGAEDVQYEAIGHLNHQGRKLDDFNNGHWTCYKRIYGQWWRCDDTDVKKTNAKGSCSEICTVVLKRST